MSIKEDQEGREAAYFCVGVAVLYVMVLAGIAGGMSVIIGTLKLWGIL